MKTVIAVLVLPILAACGAGSSDDPAPLADPSGDVFNQAGPVVNACASTYYMELVGDYDGQISYTKDDGSQSCAWEVELQISSAYTSDPTTRRFCDLTYNMASTGATSGCTDIGTGGDLLDRLASPNDSDQWTDTPWPVDAFASMAASVPESTVYPIGIANVPTSQFTIRFDGRGNVTFPANDEIMPEWSGVLVKQ